MLKFPLGSKAQLVNKTDKTFLFLILFVSVFIQ